MLRDGYGHPVTYRDDGFGCPVPEHRPDQVIGLGSATVVWERDADA